MKSKTFGVGITITVSSLIVGATMVLGRPNVFFNTNALLYQDYSLRLNGTTNVLEGDNPSIVTLGGGNARYIEHSGYSHTNNDNWGILANNGYFKVTDRIGGLTSVNYHISEDLVIKYGFSEYNKREYYELPLLKDLDSLSFPGGGQGYPDVFTIANQSGKNVTISDMTFFYTCDQNDLHGHDCENEVHMEVVNEQVNYYHNCKICNEKVSVDFSAYNITLGNSESTTKVYTPYNMSTYNGPGVLSFDYNASGDRKSFILTFNGDYTSQNLYIDSKL